jgi:hypothetical protein
MFIQDKITITNTFWAFSFSPDIFTAALVDALTSFTSYMINSKQLH